MMDQEFVVKITLAIISIIGALVSGALIPYIRLKLTMAQQEQIAEWVRVAIKAAEQLYFKPGSGEQKKRYVKAFLKTHGIEVDDEAFNVMLEAIVFEVSQINKK